MCIRDRALGIDPSVLIGGAEMASRGGSNYQQPYQQSTRRTGAPKDQMGDFVAAMLGNTEDTWTAIFQNSSQQYRAPKLRLFEGSEPVSYTHLTLPTILRV